MKKWFYLSGNDGRIHAMGEHQNIHDADHYLDENGITEVVWLFSEDTAKDWLQTLVKELSN